MKNKQPNNKKFSAARRAFNATSRLKLMSGSTEDEKEDHVLMLNYHVMVTD